MTTMTMLMMLQTFTGSLDTGVRKLASLIGFSQPSCYRCTQANQLHRWAVPMYTSIYVIYLCHRCTQAISSTAEPSLYTQVFLSYIYVTDAHRQSAPPLSRPYVHKYLCHISMSQMHTGNQLHRW